MKFDLSSLTDLNITSAKLFLYCTKARNPPSDLEVDVNETGDAWDEDTIIWNNAPAVGSFVAANMTVGEKDKYYSWDISSYFFAQLAGDQNLSLVVKLPLDDPTVNNPDQEREFASSENSDPNKRPYLKVTYERPPPVASFTFSPPSPQVNETVTFNASGSYVPDPVGKTLTAFFTYTLGTYSSYNLVATLVDDIESADCGSVEVYDNGTYIFIKSDVWSKPYLAFGELDKDGDNLIDPTATDKNGDGIIDRYDLKSDGITITGIGPGYDWYVDSDVNGNPIDQRDPEITVPSWDLNLSSGGILDGSIQYYATIPVPTNGTTFNIDITIHASPADPDYVPPKPLVWIVSYTWDFGDSTPPVTTTNPVINHTYVAYGTYNVTLNVTDSLGRWDTETKLITVRAHPHAEFTWTPVSPQTGQPVTFNASNSTPDGGNITQYKWDFDDGNVTSTTNPIIIHIYNAPGQYNVTLIVFDSEGKNDTAWNIVNVTSPPTVKFLLTVRTDPVGLSPQPTRDPSGDPGPTSDSWWYGNCTYVNLTAPQYANVSTDTRYRFDYWDVDGANVSGNPITVHMDANHTATAHYILQYYLTVISPYGTPSGEGWYNSSTLAYASLDTGMVDHGNDTRRVFTNWSGDASGTNYAQSNPILMDGPKTATANWKTQYLVTFNQTGLDNTANSTVVTVNASPKNFTDLPFSMWVDNGSSVTYNYNTVVPSTISGKRFRLDSISSPPSPFTVTGPVTITGNYKTQYQLTVRTNGLGTNSTNVYNGTTVLGTATDATPYTNWFDDGSSLQLNIDSPITVGSTKFMFIQWSGDAIGTSRPVSVTMDSAKDITANYKTQYEVTFSQSGVGTDFTGTVVTIDGTGYNVTDLPVSFWWDENSQHNFSFVSPLVVNASKQYVWISTSGLSSFQNDTLTITGPGSVTGYYSTGIKYQITFDQTGVGSDFNGTIVTIDSIPYNRTTLSVSFWWDEGSIHNFTFQSPLVVTPNAKQCLWNTTSGLSSLQSGSITVSMSGSVIGNYKTQYYLTMSTNFGTVIPGDGWHDAGSNVSINATPPSAGPGERYIWNGWTGTGTGSYSGMANPAFIIMDGPITETASWTHEYRLTMATNYGTTNPSVGDHWYEAGSSVQINATAPSVGAGERYVWNGWTGSGTGSYSGMDKPASITMDSPITETASWIHEYYLTVSSAHGTTGGEGWYGEGDTAYATVTPLTVSGPTGVRYVFTNWSGDASGTSSSSNPITMDGPKTAVANWKTQYKLIVKTDPLGLSPGPTPPTDWYDESTNVVLTAQTVSGYTLKYWDVDGPSQGSGVNPITVLMDGPHTATAHYQPAPPPPPPPPGVGGYALPINLDSGTSSSLTPQIGLVSALSVAVAATIILVRRRKKTLKRKH